MKKAFIYSAIVLLAAGTACNKTDSVLPGDGQIRFALTSPETRALVENETDLQAQTIKVYDLLDGTNYFDATETVKYDASEWKFQNGKGYTWKSGTHKFFAYTNGAGNFADNKLTVAKTLTTAEANQVDLVYSNIVSKTAKQAKEDSYNPVSLNMDHLFAAVAITVQNFSGNEVTLNSVSKPAIPNSGSATVDFSGDAVAVTYGDVTADDDFSTATALATTNLAAAVEAAEATGDTPAVEAKDGGKVDVIGQAVTTDPAYYIVWPQTIEEGSEIAVTVNYTMKGKTYNKTVKIPAGTWSAGKKYNYTLQIFPTDVRLIFKVMPWDSIEVGDIDTSIGSINMTNVTWQNTKVIVNGNLVNTVVDSAYTVNMYYHPDLPVYGDDGKPQTTGTYEENVYGEYYEEDVYQTYEEDVIDEETGEVIHAKGDFVLDDDGEKILLHSAGDPVEESLIHKAGDPIYDTDPYEASDYYPAQGYFTVNYPNAGLFKIELIPAYGETEVEPEFYDILIYDNTIANPEAPKDEQHPVGFRAIDPDGEDITNNTVYFRVCAAGPKEAQGTEGEEGYVPAFAGQDGAQHKAQINILFKPTDSDEWISAYSEIRANYALVIPATN